MTRASLAAADGSHAFEELEFQVEPPSAREGESAVYLRVTLPTGVRAGLYTLTLLAGAHEARAQVYLLQGAGRTAR